MSFPYTVYVVIFAVVLFSRILHVSPRENVNFNTWLFIVMKTSQNLQNKNLQKYLYAKYMALYSKHQ